LDELWIREIDGYRFFLQILKMFDLVVLYYSQTAKVLGDILNRQCMFLPPGVDTTLFSPVSARPRVIDVYSIGRRSETTHQRLLEMVDETGGRFFYLYDTIAGDQAINGKQHRALLADLAKRSRYFIVNPGLIDRPEKRGNQIEIGNRYFEGAASGAILVGERPDNGEFEKLFDWPDALIHLPYGSSRIDSIIAELDKQPEREAQIRRSNIVNALLRHDWVYRWEAVLKRVGLAPMPELLERKSRLRSRAEDVSREDPHAFRGICAVR
jgi:hypothetical protein